MIGHVRKPKSVLDLGPVAIDTLAAAVRDIPDAFWQHEDAVKDNAYPCFHQTQHILFRFVARDAAVRDFEAKPLWAAYQAFLLPVMRQAIAGYGFAEPLFPKAMLAKLVAHGAINRHRDGAGTNLVTHKIHVPLQTNPKALFEAGNAIVHLERGRAYEVNNVGAHAARNDGEEDRIHFIFEVCEGRAGAAGTAERAGIASPVG